MLHNSSLCGQPVHASAPGSLGQFTRLQPQRGAYPTSPPNPHAAPPTSSAHGIDDASDWCGWMCRFLGRQQAGSPGKPSPITPITIRSTPPPVRLVCTCLRPVAVCRHARSMARQVLLAPRHPLVFRPVLRDPAIQQECPLSLAHPDAKSPTADSPRLCTPVTGEEGAGTCLPAAQTVRLPLTAAPLRNPARASLRRDRLGNGKNSRMVRSCSCLVPQCAIDSCWRTPSNAASVSCPRCPLELAMSRCTQQPTCQPCTVRSTALPRGWLHFGASPPPPNLSALLVEMVGKDATSVDVQASPGLSRTGNCRRAHPISSCSHRVKYSNNMLFCFSSSSCCCCCCCSLFAAPHPSRLPPGHASEKKKKEGKKEEKYPHLRGKARWHPILQSRAASSLRAPLPAAQPATSSSLRTLALRPSPRPTAPSAGAGAMAMVTAAATATAASHPRGCT